MIAQTTQEKPKTRFIGVDVFKGWGVWYMFIIHAFIQQIAGYNGTLFLMTIDKIGAWWPYVFALPNMGIELTDLEAAMDGFQMILNDSA